MTNYDTVSSGSKCKVLIFRAITTPTLSLPLEGEGKTKVPDENCLIFKIRKIEQVHAT
jgi:hypothetical protein